ncbi:STAS-like domain-containing protein [Candidatus Gottesmanbacteria bacterium]|nr:STAS-like domain-containing protein [Candidatus Gottesmanbacteria bacterium]
MIIEIKKFGTTLVSHSSGKEAWLAFQPVLNTVSDNEEILVDFADVMVLTPSWADEFLTPLRARYGQRVTLKNTDNASVKATLAILDKQYITEMEEVV